MKVLGVLGVFGPAWTEEDELRLPIVPDRRQEFGFDVTMTARTIPTADGERSFLHIPGAELFVERILCRVKQS